MYHDDPLVRSVLISFKIIFSETRMCEHSLKKNVLSDYVAFSLTFAYVLHVLTDFTYVVPLYN
jgi:hypothetical protein